MATLARASWAHDMPWPLVVVGILFGIAMIMMQVKSPMLVSVGMYLPFETTFAIFVGGVFRSLGDWVAERRGFQRGTKSSRGKCGSARRVRIDRRRGIPGPGLGGIAIRPQLGRPESSPQIFSEPSYLVGGMIVLAGLAALMIFLPSQRGRSERTGAPDRDDVKLPHDEDSRN